MLNPLQQRVKSLLFLLRPPSCEMLLPCQPQKLSPVQEVTLEAVAEGLLAGLG